jgi:hypothetical protein
VYAGEDIEDMHRVGNVLVTASTLPLGLELASDVYVVTRNIGLRERWNSGERPGLRFVGRALVIYPLAVSAMRYRK